MNCVHCGDALRREGLALVAESDDTAACHAADLRSCGFCRGKGCGSCEGNGEVYGTHEAPPTSAADLRPLDREPVAVRAPFDVRRPLIHNPHDSRADRTAAIREALSGVDLGAHDERFLAWMSGWDTGTVGSLVSLLDRVRAAGAR